VFALEPPWRTARAVGGIVRWGATIAGGYAAAAGRHGDRAAIIDDRGVLTFAEVLERSENIARSLRELGVDTGDDVAVMARNHRGIIEATVAATMLGAGIVYLNTGFAAPQLAGVVERERPEALIYDEEFESVFADVPARLARVLSWSEPGGASDTQTLSQLAQAGAGGASLRRPPEAGRVVVLTSGTTGAPKGAARSLGGGVLASAAAILSRIPLDADGTTHIAAPIFHSWGLAHLTLSLPLRSTLVLRRRFDALEALRAVSQHRADALVVVPVMLSRMLEVDDEELAALDVACLRVIASSGSALPGDLARRVMDRFGDVLYNLYGSTEVAWATIAGPRELREAPGTAGTPPPGTEVRILDASGSPVPAGTTGRIFVGNGAEFEGYTGGGSKEVVGGLMSTGDVGHVDEHGHLFIDGRDDEMIVSGGENVYPVEVEDLLATHDEIADVAVVGVEDEQFGHRLAAHVVLRAGATLDAESVREHVRANLARYKVPRDVVFHDELPRNATGKILRRELRAEQPDV